MSPYTPPAAVREDGFPQRRTQSLHRNDWGPYQHRFKTNSFTKFVNGVLATSASTIASARVAGVVAASLTDDYFGDYLRYIG